MTPCCSVCWTPMTVLRPNGDVPNHEGEFAAPCAGIGTTPSFVDMGCAVTVGTTLDVDG